jgi:hypothetical protein
MTEATFTAAGWDPQAAARLAITERVHGWIYRDLGEWDALRDLFHPDGIIDISWFNGTADEFVEASKRMSRSPFQSKHMMSTPLTTIRGERAIAETNAIIIGENAELGLGVCVHCRLYDRFEARGGTWKIVVRQAIYDFANFTFPRGPIAVDHDLLDEYPRPYAALAYVLEKSGFPLASELPTKGSAPERDMKRDGLEWLTETRTGDQ